MGVGLGVDGLEEIVLLLDEGFWDAGGGVLGGFGRVWVEIEEFAVFCGDAEVGADHDA